MRRSITILLTLCSVLVAAPSAASDGLPAMGIQAGLNGVSPPSGGVRYITIPDGRHTLLAQLDARGSVTNFRSVGGMQTIPQVANDGSASGLSHDGATLVLYEPPNGRSTTLHLYRASSLRPYGHVRLRGWWSFDALSPDGSRAYLVHYLAPSRDLARYDVRAYDLTARRLVPGAIVDPREPDEKMHGMPMTRISSPDGRWAYTLYDGTEHPFVHALDTVGGTAACIDVDGLDRQQVASMRLRLTAGRLEVRDPSGGVLAAIDTRTQRAVPVVAAAARHIAPPARGGAFPLWLLGAAIVALLAAAAGVLGGRGGRQTRRGWSPGPPGGAA